MKPATRIAAFLFCALCSPAFALGSDTVELQTGWRMAPAKDAGGEVISQRGYDVSAWYRIAKMPSTVLQTLEDNGVYPNLYVGMNFASVPHDLYKQQWWYRTTFSVPAKGSLHWLVFKGINYRAEIWLNGKMVAGDKQIVGMYNQFELNVTKWIKPGSANVLAAKVTPEQRLQDIEGVVELADSWHDWINWQYLGVESPKSNDGHFSFVPDRNAGIWKQVYLRSTGPVVLDNPYVASDLPLPELSPASLSVYCDLKNGTGAAVEGTLYGEISRPGRPAIEFHQAITLSPDETREIVFDPKSYPQLVVKQPDLWWPYTWGTPNLYRLKLEFRVDGTVSDQRSIHFGIRKITQLRDSDNQFPDIGPGGNFYLQVNGRDYLIRGAVYTPDLLYRYDPEREQAILHYVKDLGLNLLRWESKISSESVVEMADREGIPLMFGWMCCNQWEKWDQWNDEDQTVARDSLRAQLRMLRSHPSVFIWANGSDGLPPEDVRRDYNRIAKDDLRWQNAVVNTVSEFNKDKNGNTVWDGIHMQGPYSWRPPNYWFNPKYGPPRGSCAEQGDNEHIPPYESLKKFIPADRLWPINEYWYFHAGAIAGNNRLSTIRKAIDERYGPAQSAEEFAAKAQMAHYENTRAQFESFASNWANHKMTLYWMLNNHWPSFFGHLFDYYLKPGGAYFGAKKALRPLSVVYDYYAGDKTEAKITVVNQTPADQRGLRASVKFYNLDGTVKYSSEAKDVQVAASSAMKVLTVPRVQGLSSVFFVRCQLSNSSGSLLADNVYWQSTTEDETGDPAQDSDKFVFQPAQWGNFTALNTLPTADVDASARLHPGAGGETNATIRINNRSDKIAFFMRVELTKGKDGNEILPITYDDNYVTLFPRESVTIQARYRSARTQGQLVFLRLEGRNVAPEIAAVTALH